MMGIKKGAKIVDIHLMLSTFSVFVMFQNKASLLDFNQYAEDLFCELLNQIKDWNLKNLNQQSQNAVGIDLIDTRNKIIVQVSSERSRKKVKDALKKIPPQYSGYTFFFLCFNILSPPKWKNNQFQPPNYVNFNAATNVISIEQLAAECRGIGDKRLDKVWNILSSYVRGDTPDSVINTNQINAWIVSSSRAYKRFNRLHQNFNMQQVNGIVHAEHTTHPYIAEFQPELLSLKGAHLGDPILQREALGLDNICKKFLDIEDVGSRSEIMRVNHLAQEGMHSILRILTRLAQRAGISEKVVQEFFFQYLNS